LAKGILLFTFGISKKEKMKCSELLRKIKKAGWYEVRQSGSHIIMRHNDRTNTLILPNHGSKEIKKGTAEDLLKQAGLK
jgi:predicted RNA binding protein YcfA (HicA-like mRNA interferase family)